MLNEIKRKQDKDNGNEGRVSSVGGDSTPLCCLPYMAFITALNVWEKQTAWPSCTPKKQRQVQCVRKQTLHICMSKNLYTLASTYAYSTHTNN